MLKKKLYKIILLAAIIICAFIMILLLLPENKVFRFVNKHQSELQGFIQDFFQNHTDESGNMPKEFLGCSIEYVSNGTVPIIQFTYSGSGIAPSSDYYGFYYSPDDQPHVYWNYEAPMEKTASNKWTYQMGGDNHGLTKKIRENWYYFKASF